MLQKQHYPFMGAGIIDRNTSSYTIKSNSSALKSLTKILNQLLISGGWTARVVQHEFDHLQGKMFVDKADLSTLTFDYWKLVNMRLGDFRLGFDGVKPGPTRFLSKFFHQK